MRSPTYAFVWELWARQRVAVAAIAGVTAVGRFLEPSPVVAFLWMLSFVLLFGVFTRGIPHRLFTLPVSSLRIVAVPMVTGIISVELLNVIWLDRLLIGPTSAWFVALLCGVLMVFYQASLWMLESLGPLKLVVVGVEVVIVFGIGLLPSFPPTPPPLWRSELGMAAVATGLAVMAFLLAWRHVARMRCGGGSAALRFKPLLALAGARLPRTRRAFASPAAAHFWFEWRSSGLALPLVVGGVLVALIAPQSWFARGDADASFRLLLGTLATPIVLAIPVGMAFGRPAFWSEDLSLPAFIAVRPMTDNEIVAAKLKTAAASVGISWLLVFAFLLVWLPLWANLDSMSRFAIQLWAFHGQSVAAAYGIIALLVIGGILLTWRFLVSRLCSGLLGSRTLFNVSVTSVVIAVIAWLVFDGTRLPAWVLDDPARMSALAWILSIAVVSKYWLAARSWRRMPRRYAWQSLLLWGAGTACFLALAILFRGIARVYIALDIIYSFQAVLVLTALLTMPLGRFGLAAACLARNRHR
jgi:hypothetical protein